MFRHRGKSRTLGHNLKIASLLSFVAGIVNVVGFLAVQRLTTNVTGHFAFFIDELFKLHFWQGVVYFLYIFFFFAGSFCSGLLVEWVARKEERYTFYLPVVLECIILLLIGIRDTTILADHADTIVYSLLFAMGMQNSLVTSISNAVVRTTHLTGLFTDLGIELSQLFFYKASAQKKKLYSSIKLRFTIISFFFIGGITGGILYTPLRLHTLILPAVILMIGMTYDYARLRVLLLKRRLRNNAASE